MEYQHDFDSRMVQVVLTAEMAEMLLIMMEIAEPYVTTSTFSGGAMASSYGQVRQLHRDAKASLASALNTICDHGHGASYE
jgi:hypothetical protein